MGTQMIAKGLDFPNVTVVGIISADQALHIPMIRAAERTYQLIAQVAGRAGRGEKPGRIVVQTQAPEHPAIRLAAKNDYEAFAEAEAAERELLLYPPHGDLLQVVVEDTEEERVLETAKRCGDELRAALAGSDLEIMGPAPAPVSLLRGRHRHNLLVKAPRGSEAFARARAWLVDFAGSSSRPHVVVDVDPA